MDEQQELTPLERFVERNGDPEVIPPSVMTAYRSGRIKAARALLMKHSKTERNGVRKAAQEEALRELRYWVTPAEAPTMYTLNGVGTSLYGSYQEGEDGLHVGTFWFVVLFLPIFPISAYLVARAEEGGFYFFGKTPLPPFARVWRSLLFTGILLMGLAIGFGAYKSTTTTDILAWNAFAVPVEVAVGDVTATVQAQSDYTFRDVPAEALPVLATANGITIDDFEGDFGGTSTDTVLYNIGSRGVHEKLWVRYGPGEPPEGDLVSGGPIILLDDIDYPFREPPDEKQVVEGGHIDNTLLESLDVDLPAVNLMMLLVTEDRADDALAMMGSELLMNDEAHQYAWFVTTMALGGDNAAGKQWLRPILDVRGDSIELHRAWQELHSAEEKQALIAEYRARLAAAPDSADAHYLLARLLDGRDDETIAILDKAVTVDPTHSRSWGSLGWNKAIRGDYDGALAAYRKQVEVDSDSFGDAQPEMIRLIGLSGGSLNDQLDMAETGMPEGMSSWLGAHMRISARPSKADTIHEAWTAGEQVDPLYSADLMVTGGRFESARKYMAASDPESADMNMSVSVPIRLAMSDGASGEDRDRAGALLGAELPMMNEMVEIQALAFATKHGLDGAAGLEESLAGGDMAGLVPAITGSQDAETTAKALAGLGLRFQAAGAAALAYVSDGADRARWRKHARTVGTPDELPFWK